MFDFLVVLLACTLNERMQKKLDYTQEEVRVRVACSEQKWDEPFRPLHVVLVLRSEILGALSFFYQCGREQGQAGKYGQDT